ncbi:hypothetical protein Taro_015973 [Colocasia esculenta]|uniref:Multiple inositol polyphosphate phosphatase 1 n=1 Tax=Colocasia esculenta TaxID=4460 RepID=A0A843UJC2_COLES|nr:hypothetical protein [Colocasia esculenta]
MVTATRRSIPLLLLLLLFSPWFFSSPNATGEEAFDVRHHLSTVTRYDTARNVANDNGGAFVVSTVPDGCHVVHLNLVARHGTRSPTKKRIGELDQLEIRLHNLLKEVKGMSEQNMLYVQKFPPWLWGWQSPWKGRQKGGELLSQGEDELYHLGIRIREKFPELFDEEYHPDVFSIRATQVPRASASAVAFGMGLFAGKGSLGPGRHRSFAVISESRASDICLRFFDTCETYEEFRKSQEPAVDKLKEPILDEITSALTSRYQLNFTRHDIASLWFLCKQEASLLDTSTQACALFNSYEVSLLEWTDDLEGFILKGYGQAVNYRMGIPLLQDVFQSMEEAIVAKEENKKTYEKARLRFAHAETVVPFTCLLGLFLDGSEFEQIQHEKPLDLPPKPPKKRNWRGNVVAPFAGNNMLVLYGCSRNNTNGSSLFGKRTSNYFVQVLHNEVPVKMPGCDSRDFCPFEDFKEKVVNPHLKHGFESVCKVNLEYAASKLQSKSWLLSRKLSRFFHWLFFLEDSKVHTHNHEEL